MHLRQCTVFWLKWPVHDLVLVIPPPPVIKVVRNTRPCSKLGGTTLNGSEDGGQYYILQTCDWQRFEARQVVFSSECLNIFATGCSTTIDKYILGLVLFDANDVQCCSSYAKTLNHTHQTIPAVYRWILYPD